MTEIIDGKAVGDNVVATVKALTADLLQASGKQPGLAVVIVGEDPASQVYVASKSRKAKECGFHSLQHTLPADTSEAELLSIIAELNADPAINGILVQLPLPAHIDSEPRHPDDRAGKRRRRFSFHQCRQTRHRRPAKPPSCRARRPAPCC